MPPTFQMIAKMGRQPKCPSAGGRIKKMRSIPTMDYSSALKRKELLQLETTWVDLDDSMLSKTSRSQNKHRMIRPMGASIMIEFIESKSGMVVARGWKEGEMGPY